MKTCTTALAAEKDNDGERRCTDWAMIICNRASTGAAQKSSDADLENTNSKAVTYKDDKACVKAFKDRNGTVICRELKGLDSPDKKVVRTCPDCIKDAVEIIEATLYGGSSPEA